MKSINKELPIIQIPLSCCYLLPLTLKNFSQQPVLISCQSSSLHMRHHTKQQLILYFIYAHRFKTWVYVGIHSLSSVHAHLQNGINILCHPKQVLF